MNRVLVTIGIAALVALVGCRRAPYQEPYQGPMFPTLDTSQFERFSSHPEIGAQQTVEIGESMVSTSKVLVLPIIVAERSQRVVTPYSTTLLQAFDLPSGVAKLVGFDHAGRYFSFGQSLPHYYEDKKNKGQFEPGESPVEGGIYVANTGAKHLYWRWNRGYPITMVPADNLTFQAGEDRGDRKNTSFRRELVYSGGSGSTINLLYREFSNDMARPAFSQELRYDLTQSRIIGYRGARFELLRTDNTGITYKVISHLPEPER